jgi:hypothetical protein
MQQSSPDLRSHSLAIFREKLGAAAALPGGLKPDIGHAVVMLDEVFGPKASLCLFYGDLLCQESVRRTPILSVFHARNLTLTFVSMPILRGSSSAGS